MTPLATDATVSAGTNLWPELIKSSLMLCVVLIVLVGFLLLLKRFLSQQTGVGSHGYIKMLASHYLSQKERVVLMDVLGEKILIGVTAQGINCLARIGASGMDSMPDIPENELPETGKNNFIKRITGNNGPMENKTGSHDR